MSSAEHQDSGKPALDLIPPQALWEMDRVFAYGAGKYSPDNWRKGMNWRRLGGSVLRHVTLYLSGQDRDKESGCTHLGMAMADCAMLLDYYFNKLGTDDRLKAPVDMP